METFCKGSARSWLSSIKHGGMRGLEWQDIRSIRCYRKGSKTTETTFLGGMDLTDLGSRLGSAVH